MERVIAYIDGFNLYHAIKNKGWRRYQWLDVRALAENLLKPHQSLVCVRYFTARINFDPVVAKRQHDYLEALATLAQTTQHFGKYVKTRRACSLCKSMYWVSTEKMTDVNIASAMMVDAFYDSCDTLLLLSADSDLCEPVREIRQLFPSKRVVAVFPPEHHCYDLEHSANAWFVLGRAKLAQSKLPLEVSKPDGFILHCPAEWR